MADHPSAVELARLSVELGLRGFSWATSRAAAWRVWTPLDVDRVVELPWTGQRILAAGAGPVLDLSSPKLLAAWLAGPGGLEVVATDVWTQEVENWKRLLSRADPDHARFHRLRLEVADGMRLPYADSSFSAAFSSSVIEHIPGDGDSATMAELARVVRPGGLLALTFPYGPVHRNETVDHDLYGEKFTGVPLFFQRHYSELTVDSRLLGDGSWEVVERGMWRKPGAADVRGARPSFIPASWGVGRYLGPGLMIIGSRGMKDHPVEDPGPTNVLRLLLRRR